MSASKPRTQNYTEKEKNLLILTVDRYKKIIENKASNACSLKEKNEAWIKVADEFNANNCEQAPREPKQLKNLYFNLKRNIKKDVAEEHKEEYWKKIAANDKKELNKTGGGSYQPKLDETGAQLLAMLQDQIEPLSNPFDNAADYFNDDIIMFDIEPVPAEKQPEPEPELESEPEPIAGPSTSTITNPKSKPQKNKKKVLRTSLDYKKAYFKKKYELACFELKSKKVLHSLDIKI